MSTYYAMRKTVSVTLFWSEPIRFLLNTSWFVSKWKIVRIVSSLEKLRSIGTKFFNLFFPTLLFQGSHFTLRYFSYFSLKEHLVLLFAFFILLHQIIFTWTAQNSKSPCSRLPQTTPSFPRVPGFRRVLELYQDRFLLQFYYIFTKRVIILSHPMGQLNRPIAWSIWTKTFL